ncbi:hypothetical protein TPB0596_24600 [Tsukamurella pulmonis]|uniref:Uncharacterized protein n=1 Tax=Tsukamurella pulmonis TaxID=47312 RepID=A0A1H1EX30_9ACTN|nr:hypothetical protein [Tsukamurella pulmonis]KXO91770.1 hypothetical protein AXK56_01190 [Tsukamurella pulmonis]KXP09424.1 hypothetical protein AXK57_11060 [Tsukamurella pulmonis]RDH12111.1 hypothetical protein DVB88_09145 [Tsukamurella pulmonis]SDQ93213.1 hypothetical protein SAMN04489765_2399 [Tsukamurella pulmonis]SUP20385.1 Uncharacterised protein [Tsukamurella pulmonis]
MDTFTGRELYEAFHADYDAVTDRDARIYDAQGRLLAAGRLAGLRLDESSGAEVVEYSFTSLHPDLPWDAAHRIELAPQPVQ